MSRAGFLFNIGRLLMIGALVARGVLAQAQAPAGRKLQVVTRTIERTLACPVGTVVRIQADKATVRVQGWDQPTVRVVLRLSARHPDRATAEKDLAAAQYRIAQPAGAVDLVNYVALPAGAPAPASDLRADYTVLMPAANALQVTNAYGQTSLTGLNGRQKLTQNFGQVTLHQLRGTLDATVQYADLTGTDLQMVFTCQAEKSALQLKTLGGSCAIRNRYGSIRLEPTDELTNVVIDAERTEVVVLTLTPARFNYQLGATHGTLNVPVAHAPGGGPGSHQTSWKSASPGRRPLIRITTTYAPITLQSTAGAQLSPR